MKIIKKIVNKQDVLTSLMYVSSAVITDMEIEVNGHKGTFDQLIHDVIEIVKKETPDNLTIESRQVDKRYNKTIQQKDETIHFAQLDREQVAGSLKYVTDSIITVMREKAQAKSLTNDKLTYYANLIGALQALNEQSWNSLGNRTITIEFKNPSRPEALSKLIESIIGKDNYNETNR